MIAVSSSINLTHGSSQITDPVETIIPVVITVPESEGARPRVGKPGTVIELAGSATPPSLVF